jgi:uncharacterized membrane protein YphA (DoxX/SURF4 family)
LTGFAQASRSSPALLPPEKLTFPVHPMRSTLLAVAALAFLRIVVGMHFFLEGLSHLRDPGWSSAGFRRAAVGPLADFYQSELPQTGNWSETLGKIDKRSIEDALDAWKASVVATWQRRLEERQKLVPLDEASMAEAKRCLQAAEDELDAYAADKSLALGEYRSELARRMEMESSPEAARVPFIRELIAKGRRALAAQQAEWMRDAEAIGAKLESNWDEPRTGAERQRLSGGIAPTRLWKADRFVSWSLVTIGACLVLGILVKFNAMGGVCFLASIIASQPFWVPDAQATYDQWVELAALLAIASLPTGGWSGLDFFFGKWLGNLCPLTGCSRTKSRD